MNYPYYWRVRTRLPERFGQHLRVIVRGGMNSALVEFQDGSRFVSPVGTFSERCNHDLPQVGERGGGAGGDGWP